MPTIKASIPITVMAPALGHIDSGALINAQQVIPVGRKTWAHFYLQGDLETNTVALNTAVYGRGYYDDTLECVWYQDGAGINRVNLRTGALTAVEGVGVGFTEGVKFLRWGADVLWTEGTGGRPRYAPGGTGAAADLLDATSIANNDITEVRYVAPMGLRIMFANLRNATTGVNYPDRVWWSATNNARRFGTAATDPALRTGFQDLPDEDYGITGLFGANDFAYIFKRSRIYRMDYGGQFGFTFKPFVVGLGMERGGMNGIVGVGEDVYFWSTRGPAVIRKNEAPVLIGRDGIEEAIQINNWSPIALANQNVPSGLAHGTYLPSTNAVAWGYGYNIGGSVLLNRVICYHIDSGRWSLLFPNVTAAQPEALFTLFGVSKGAASATQTSLAGDDLWAMVYDNPNVRLVNCNTSATSLANWKARFQTGWVTAKSLGGVEVAKIERIRPIAMSADSTPNPKRLQFSGTVGVTTFDSAEQTSNIATTADPQGWMTVDSAYGAAFRFTLDRVYNGTADEESSKYFQFDALEVELTPDGSY